uniref:Spectrin beta, non-erythrocytic 4 n=1 Tax=Ornithorhynchus anatinus TaxID=9258 RepID=A0A6I8NU58_ORNAN
MPAVPGSNNNNGPRWESPERGWERERERDPAAPAAAAAAAASLFECSRIRALADEREAVQKKTFTKWVNSHLARVSCRIGDLYSDLRDGYVLTQLLEVLSGEPLPRPTRGRMRIHSLENVDKALQFLKEQRVHLENVGSHDIVDGNHRLTLGLVWTIILRFQIQVIKIEAEDNRETRSAKDALLLWCQMKTAGYPEVNIQNFTTSWRDGLAFNALIHRHRPDLVDFSKLTKSNATYNLQQAFRTAEQQLGLAKLLDPEDVNMETPDEKSIITYVVSFYHYFSKMKALAVEGKRIGKVLDQVLEIGKIIERYEELAGELLAWIERTVGLISNQKFANSLSGVQQQLQAFTAYCTLEKPVKFQEKGNLEVLLFSIQSKLRASNRKLYVPSEGRSISDINKAWTQLEKAEHEREAALRGELIRQEKLELLAQRFDHKAAMRESWLSENQRLVSQDNFGYDLPAVEAAMKKHEAIEADISSYEERIQAVVELAQALAGEGYYDARRIGAQRDSVLRQWGLLTGLVVARRGRLEQNLALQKVFQEMVYMIDWMEEMQVRLVSRESGKHLLEVEDLLQKHGLLEGDIAAQAERVETLNAAALRFSQLQGTAGPWGRTPQGGHPEAAAGRGERGRSRQAQEERGERVPLTISGLGLSLAFPRSCVSGYGREGDGGLGERACSPKSPSFLPPFCPSSFPPHQPSPPLPRELPPGRLPNGLELLPERTPRPDRPRARDRPKPRRRPRPREPSGEGGGGRRSRSAPAQGSSAPPPPPPTHTVQLEGFLLRKRELEGPNRKASNRSWVNLYCVLSKGELGFYKDAKGPGSGSTHGGEPLLSLQSAVSEVANDYKKKKNVFKLKTHDGSEFLLQAKDEVRIVWSCSPFLPCPFSRYLLSPYCVPGTVLSTEVDTS